MSVPSSLAGGRGPATAPSAMRRRILSAPLLVALPWMGQGRSVLAAPSAEQASRLLGTYQGPGCGGTARLTAFTDWLGRTPTRHSDFLSDRSWVEMVKAAQRGSLCWAPTGLDMSVGVPMLPRHETADLASGARGVYDVHFTQIAKTLVRNKLGNAVIRLGWEFNHDWFPWRADRDPVAWVGCWRSIVGAMRAVDGASFRFDWCTGWGRGKVAPEQVYPGDDFVDIIGMDIYNTTWNPLSPTNRWNAKMNQPYGLAWQRKFATEHGKPVSFPEWGTGKRPDGRGGGDDPYYIEKMAEWLATSNLAYHNYWDYKAPDFNCKLSDGSQPLAAAAFLKAFGGTAR